MTFIQSITARIPSGSLWLVTPRTTLTISPLLLSGGTGSRPTKLSENETRVVNERNAVGLVVVVREDTMSTFMTEEDRLRTLTARRGRSRCTMFLVARMIQENER